MKENSRAVVVQMSDDRGWVVINNNSSLFIKLFNSRDYQSYYIDCYAKEGETTREYIKPSDNYSTEIIEEMIDSAIFDY